MERTWKKKHLISNPFLRYGLLIVVIAYLLIAGSGIKVDPVRIANGVSRIGKLFSGFFHPDFASRGKYIVTGILESIANATQADTLITHKHTHAHTHAHVHTHT